MDIEKIPDELKSLVQWVCWKQETDKKGKSTKIPYIAKVGELANASTTKRETWKSFEDAINVYRRVGCDGIGFVFTANDSYCGIDLDHAINEAGNVETWAADILNRFQSYAEKSPSERGIHIIVKAKLAGPGTKKELPGYPGSVVEVYDRGRYFTMTGNVMESYTIIQERQKDVDWLYNLLKPPKAEPTEKPIEKTYHKHNMTNQQILDVIRKSKQAEKFNQLFSGDLAGYPSQSEADLALCSILAFYTQDLKQILSIIQDSSLWDDKWEREDYQRMTIGKALAGVTETYRPKGKKEPFKIIETDHTFPTIHSILFNDYMNLLADSTEAPGSYHFFCLASVVGMAIGKGAYYPYARKLYSNIYALLVGQAAFGRKSTAMGYIYDLIASVLPKINLINSIDSYEGLLESLAKKPNPEQLEMLNIEFNHCLAVIDEFKAFMKKARNQATENLIPSLCHLYDCPPFIKKLTKTNPLEVKEPFFSIVAGIQPGVISDSFQSGDLHGGFASRFMYVIDQPTKYIPFPKEPDQAVWNSIIERIHLIKEHFNGKSIPFILEDQESWETFYMNIAEKGRTLENDLLACTLGRIPDHVLKLALLLACADVCQSEYRYTITKENLQDAFAIGQWLMKNTEKLFCEFGLDEGQKIENKILEILARGPLSRKDLHKKLSGRVKGNMLSFSLESLSQIGRIQLKDEKYHLCV